MEAPLDVQVFVKILSNPDFFVKSGPSTTIH